MKKNFIKNKCDVTIAILIIIDLNILIEQSDLV